MRATHTHPFPAVFISIVETYALDMTTSATYAPSFEEATTIPVTPLDDAWMKSILEAQNNWG